MAKQPNRLWIVVLLLGWAFDLLFWKKAAGINFAIFTSLCLIGGFFLLRGYGLLPSPRSLWPLLPFGFFAVMTFLRREPLTLFLAYAFSLFSLGLLTVTYLGGRWMQYSLMDYFSKFFLLIASMIGRPIDFLAKVRTEREHVETQKKFPIWPVLRGLLIALPIVACFTALLASADAIFNQKVIEFFDQFDAGKIAEYIFRGILIVIYAFLLTGVILHAATQSGDEKLIGEDKPVVRPFLGFTEASIVLGSVAALFLVFVIIQFRYFFGGTANIGIEGFTYSQYARRGFNEMVAVAFFSLVMVLGLSTVTRRETPLEQRSYSGLSVAIVLEVLVILASAYQRLSLAIDWHGFSRLRLYPQVFMIWIGILFVAVVALEIMHRERHFALAAVLASLGFAVSLSLLNVDASIVRHNVIRATQGRQFNVYHLASLSTDAVPALVDEFTRTDLPDPVHEGLGASLMCFLYTNPQSDPLPTDWRSFQFSTWQAEQALLKAQTQLAGYKINQHGRPVLVHTPGGTIYECPLPGQEDESE